MSQSCLADEVDQVELAVAVDKFGNFFVHVCKDQLSQDPVESLSVCSFSMQETALRIKKGTLTLTERDANKNALLCVTTIGMH